MNKTTFFQIVKKYLYLIYSDELKKSDIEKSFSKIKNIFALKKQNKKQKKLWDQGDFFLITYADSIKKKQKNSFEVLNSFLTKYCSIFNFVHILPFFPFSSDLWLWSFCLPYLSLRCSKQSAGCGFISVAEYDEDCYNIR